jgi:hypothetical protein
MCENYYMDRCVTIGIIYAYIFTESSYIEGDFIINGAIKTENCTRRYRIKQ